MFSSSHSTCLELFMGNYACYVTGEKIGCNVLFQESSFAEEENWVSCSDKHTYM